MVLRKMIIGAWSGCLATVPMTIVMIIGQRIIPPWKRRTLPPAVITANLADKAGVQEQMDHQEHFALTVVGHFAYGTAAGVVYALLVGNIPLSTIIKGMIYGLLVWAASYLGLMPALGLLRPATEQPASRNALMIIAHIIWGAALGALYDQLSSNPVTNS